MKFLPVSLFLLVFVAIACKDPFFPEVNTESRDLLVVEGYLNVGGTSTIVLSRSGDLQDPQSRFPEANAKVLVESRNGTAAVGISGQNGECILNTQNLDITKSYRVKIIRTNAKMYETGFLESITTPEIDSLNFKIAGDGFEVYVNTHDPSNNTRFYSWDYNETWEIRSALDSFWELKNGRIVERDLDVNINRCWQGNSSSQILVNSTERLSQDKVSLFPLTFIEGSSIKLSHLYSILVRQYGLTREAFQYLETMKKNTEEIGTIFDPQPSELRGNIKCITTPNEQVIGWISAGTVSEKRIFISSADKPAKWAYREICEPVMTIHQDSILRYLAKDFLIHRRYYFPYPPPPYIVPAPWKYGDTIFTIAPKLCIDCTLRGANKKPSYWPN